MSKGRRERPLPFEFSRATWSANVNPIETMITLITLNREFESYQRALRLMDDATVKMLNEGARV
jgi:flagellar basal body rod protein FlgG